MGTCSSLRRRMMMGGKGNLPYDAEVEYMEKNDDSSYIDTMYHIASYNVSLEIKYMQTANTTVTSFLFYQYNDSNQYVAIYTNASNKLAAVWGNQWKASSISSDRNIHTLKLENKKLYRDGTSLFTTNNPNTFVATDNTVRIFSPTNSLLARIYWAKIYYGGTLVRDLIPVRIGQVGYMYDKISKQLFGNAGTGSFILGPDIH